MPEFIFYGKNYEIKKGIFGEIEKKRVRKEL